MTKHINLLIALWCTIIMSAFGQQTTTIIQNATIHVGNGQVIDNGVVVFEQGKIIHVGTQLNAMYKDAVYIDAKGKHVYPGLICLNSILGLNEIDAVRATRDYQEVGNINPNVRSLIAFNTDSKLLPTALFNGILYLQPVPQGGLISGTSSIVKSRAWNWEDAAELSDDGIHINWPEWGMSGEKEIQEQRLKQIENLQVFFNEATAYCYAESPSPVNLRMEAMRKVLAGNSRIYVHVSTAKGMLEAMHFFEKQTGYFVGGNNTDKRSWKIVWVGAEQGHLILDEIKKFGSPVVLNITHRLPSSNHEDIDMPFKLPYLMTQKGITVALSHSGSWESRNLVFNAGTAAAYGLSKEQALQLITGNAAQICGDEKRIGTLETGKVASLLICNGDLLDMRTNTIEQAFIDGVAVELNGEQQALYRKFMKKYGLIAE